MTAALRLVESAPVLTGLDAPVWDWGKTPAEMRPAHREECIVIWHGMPDHVSLETGCRIVLMTTETRDPSWWHDRLPGVMFHMAWHPAGYDDSAGVSSGQDLGRYGGNNAPSPVILEKPQEVVVQTPHGSMLGVLSPRPDDHGRPVYSVPLALWMPMLSKAIAKFTGKPYDGPSQSKRRRS